MHVVCSVQMHTSLYIAHALRVLPALLSEDEAFIHSCWSQELRYVLFLISLYYSLQCIIWCVHISFYLTSQDVLCCITGLFLMLLLFLCFRISSLLPHVIACKLGLNGLTSIPSCCNACQHLWRPDFCHTDASAQSAHPALQDLHFHWTCTGAWGHPCTCQCQDDGHHALIVIAIFWFAVLIMIE